MGENGSAEQVMFDWLIDTPLFVSTERIESLYNAIALPETEEQSRTISRKGTSSESTGTSLGLELAAANADTLPLPAHSELHGEDGAQGFKPT